MSAKLFFIALICWAIGHSQGKREANQVQERADRMERECVCNADLQP